MAVWEHYGLLSLCLSAKQALEILILLNLSDRILKYLLVILEFMRNCQVLFAVVIEADWFHAPRLQLLEQSNHVLLQFLGLGRGSRLWPALLI